MKKKISIVVLALVIITVVCAGFLYITKRANRTGAESSKRTEVQLIVTKNLEKEYPPTPRQVVSFYSRIITAYYGENYTAEEFEVMVDKTLALFDDELLAENPRDTYVSNLNADISSYRSNSRVISNVEVSDSKDVLYKNDKDDELAFVDASYFVKEGKNTFTKTYMQYVLRKDAEGNWKILCFYKIDAPKKD